MNDPDMSRQEVLEELSQHGISGAHVYLIDVFPLLEMMWADGQVQQIEIAILDQFLAKHVDAINERVGYIVIEHKDAHDFIAPLIETQPDTQWLREVRLLIPPLRFNSEKPEENRKAREFILGVCLDIAAGAVKQYPYELTERINADEKRCFFDILDTFGCGC
ncbi:MAG: hypothetical protein V2J55_15665 [Candidatus Competibacteraceae bacterium]|jgi:hypothetical protein|nr:hypothetical protein [Candidatus Competibacteraceae bacterium]